MRSGARWVAAVLGYALILFADAVIAIKVAWSCHPGGVCSADFARYLVFTGLGIVVVVYCLAVVVAIWLAPAHRRIVGAFAVLFPVVFLSLSMRNTLTGEIHYDHVFPIVLAGIPAAICAVLVVRKLEGSRVA